LDDESDWSARRAYNWQLNQVAVSQASVTVPLSAIERTLQRHKVRNRPALPATRQDLVLTNDQTITSDGRRFLLIDDGVGDRLMVFGTNEQLARYMPTISGLL
jgi:hypothetical protein